MAAQVVAPALPLQLRPSAPPYERLPKASLYVGDLDPGVTENDLMQEFSQIGILHSVHLCRDRLSRKSLRYGYVNFLSHGDADTAIARLNHTELKGKPMRVMWCQKDPRKRKTGEGNLFVKNLDTSVTSSRLENIFCKYGTILSCKVAEDRGKSKGFGFVQFDSVDSSMAAVDALHGTMLEGKKLYVSKFYKKDERRDAHEEPKFTNLYVKNLGESVTEDWLRNKFSEFGKLHNILIVRDTDGNSRGFGFVNFESPENGKAAMEALNGVPLGSEKLFVGMARKKVERKELPEYQHKEIINYHSGKPNSSNLYVKNLHASIDDKKLEEHFSAFGKVTSAKVMHYDNGISKGFGFVNFSTPEEAKKALHTLHGTVFQGRPLYVAIAELKHERQKKLQSYYALYPLQNNHSFYSSLPPFPMDHVSYISSRQSVMYQNFCRSQGAVYPFSAQCYQNNISTYIPARHQGTYMNTAYQQPIRYANYILPTKEMNYMSHKGKQYISWNKKSDVPSKGSCFDNNKRSIGECLFPQVENIQPGHGSKITGMLLEMDNSELKKLINSPKSLGMQVEKAIQVLKEANSQQVGDGHVAQPSKSARCLSYY